MLFRSLQLSFVFAQACASACPLIQSVANDFAIVSLVHRSLNQHPELNWPLWLAAEGVSGLVTARSLAESGHPVAQDLASIVEWDARAPEHW